MDVAVVPPVSVVALKTGSARKLKVAAATMEAQKMGPLSNKLMLASFKDFAALSEAYKVVRT